MIKKILKRLIILVLPSLKNDLKFMRYLSSFSLDSIKKISCQTETQNYYENLYNQGLIGMNYGNGGLIEVSGEKEVIAYISNKLKYKETLVLFDVGANIGDYSRALRAGFPESKSKIYAFEPSQKTFQKLTENVSGAEIHVFNIGIGSHSGELKLYSNSEGSGLASVYNRKLDHFNITLQYEEIIKISTLDDFCEKNKIERIDFLKLDIEGHELEALNGAKKLLDSKAIQFIQFEFGGCNIDSRTYFQDFFYLLNKNYTIYRVLQHGLYEIKNYRETLEIFTTINYLAELKS